MTDTDTTPDDAPATCERCGRAFPDPDLLALHRGRAHEDLTDAERDAFESAREAEDAALRRLRLLALAGLVALYFGLLMTYAVVT